MVYMKSLMDSGEWNVIQLDPSAFSVEGLLHDLYQSKGYSEASEEEYLAQFQAAQVSEEVPVAEEVAPVAAEEAPVEEAPVEEVAPVAAEEVAPEAAE